MARRPRGLVISPLLNYNSMTAALDKILVEAESARIKAQIINTATTTNGDKEYSLYAILDKGTKPHWIGEGDEVLGNKAKDFGPVYGPVFHPGTRPYDVTNRTAAFFASKLETLLTPNVLAFAGVKKADTTVPISTINKVLLNALRQTLAFSRSITPTNWELVRSSYQLKIDGERDQNS